MIARLAPQLSRPDSCNGCKVLKRCRCSPLKTGQRTGVPAGTCATWRGCSPRASYAAYEGPCSQSLASGATITCYHALVEVRLPVPRSASDAAHLAQLCMARKTTQSQWVHHTLYRALLEVPLMPGPWACMLLAWAMMACAGMQPGLQRFAAPCLCAQRLCSLQQPCRVAGGRQGVVPHAG